MNAQKGYTLVELITGIFALAVMVGIGFGIYAAVHFILKFW